MIDLALHWAAVALKVLGVVAGLCAFAFFVAAGLMIAWVKRNLPEEPDGSDE